MRLIEFNIYAKSYGYDAYEYHGIIPNLVQLVYVHILLMSASISIISTKLDIFKFLF